MHFREKIGIWSVVVPLVYSHHSFLQRYFCNIIFTNHVSVSVLFIIHRMLFIEVGTLRYSLHTTLPYMPALPRYNVTF